MLIEKTFEINDVVCVKLANGDELIAKIGSLNEQSVTLVKPLLVLLGQDPRTGQPGVQMAPFWIISADPASHYKIQRDHIICMVKPNSDAVKGYTAQTTGLTIPSGSGLIT